MVKSKASKPKQPVKKPSKDKDQSNKSGGNGEKKRKKGESTYATYISKVLKKVHPELGMSKKSLASMNSLVDILLERFAKKGAEVATHDKKTTMSARHIQAAVPLILGEELAKHAVSEGTKAVIKFRA